MQLSSLNAPTAIVGYAYVDPNGKPVATQTFKGRYAARQADEWENKMITNGYEVKLVPIN